MKLVEKPTLETFGMSAEEAVREMRFRIYQETSLTASAGDLLSLFCVVYSQNIFLGLHSLSNLHV